MLSLAQHTGVAGGICAGQGWESEPEIDLSAYHRSKTGALFVAATQMGATAAAQDEEPWHELGGRIGEVFQVADDLCDALHDAGTPSEPAGQDNLHGRRNTVTELGVDGARKRRRDILVGAIASIPSCPGEASLAQMVRMQAEQIMPVINPALVLVEGVVVEGLLAGTGSSPKTSMFKRRSARSI